MLRYDGGVQPIRHLSVARRSANSRLRIYVTPPRLRDDPVQIRAIKPQKTERFSCSERDVRSAFAATDLSSVGFGRPKRSFITLRWNTRYSPRPKFSGPVVASLNLVRYRVSDKGVSYDEPRRYSELYLYPVRQSEYSEEAAREFRIEVLPMIKNWLDAEMSKPDTQYLTGHTLVIEWTGETQKRHVLRRR